jgi:hypothetical protein
MRITTKAVFDMESMLLLEWEGYEYNGPAEMAGGGPSSQQNAAAASQAALSQQEIGLGNQMNARQNEQYNLIKPYDVSRLQNGLPFMNQMNDMTSGNVARSFAPARADLMRRTSMYGSALPSGFQQGALTDLASQQAHAYDQNIMGNAMTQEAARNNAAAQLTGQMQLANPLGYFNSAGNANQSIMQAPLAKPGLGGLLGGIAAGAASAIPF